MPVRTLAAIGITAATISATLVTGSSPALAADSNGPGMDHVAVNITKFSGTGCPENKTYIAQMLTDTSASISFKGLRADTRLGSRNTSVNCTVSVNFFYPAG